MGLFFGLAPLGISEKLAAMSAGDFKPAAFGPHFEHGKSVAFQLFAARRLISWRRTDVMKRVACLLAGLMCCFTWAAGCAQPAKDQAPTKQPAAGNRGLTNDFKEVEARATKGEAEAQFRLGDIYLKDQKEAFKKEGIPFYF